MWIHFSASFSLGRSCKLDVGALGSRRSEYRAPVFIVRDASSQRSSNLPPEHGIFQPKTGVAEEGKTWLFHSGVKQNMHFTDEINLSGSGGVSHACKYDWSCVWVLYTHVSWNKDHVKHL